MHEGSGRPAIYDLFLVFQRKTLSKYHRIRTVSQEVTTSVTVTLSMK